MTPTTRRARRAFTLIELMIAMALAVGIMWMLAEAFRSGTDIVRHARSTGDMSTQLAGAGAILTRDLVAEHFTPEDEKPNRGVRLSDQRLDQLRPGAGGTWVGWTPPKGGFVRIVSPKPDGYHLAQDAEGFYMSTATNHLLHFTSVLPGGPEGNLYTAESGGTTYYSRAAEVAYFLADSGLKTSGTTGGTLYNLIRQTRLAAVTADDQQALTAAAADTEVVSAAGGQVNTLADLTNPGRRLGSYTPYSIASNRYGEDILLSNVLSFEILPEWDDNPNITGVDAQNKPVSRAEPFPSNSDYPHDYLGPQRTYGTGPSSVAYGHNGFNSGGALAGRGVFDTWFPAPANSTAGKKAWNDFSAAHDQAVPVPIRVKALQITIRVFDPKMRMARQNSWKIKL